MTSYALIHKQTLPEQGRIIAVSDIHANLPYLKGLLQKLELAEEDTLIICGDLLEKGPESLNTLRFIMELSQRRRVFCVSGNCDCWNRQLDYPTAGSDEYIQRYMLSTTTANGWGRGLIAEMCDEIGFEITDNIDMDRMRSALRAAFVPELDFLRAMPQVIETEYYTFVHGGLPEGKPEDWGAWACMKNDNFMRQGRSFDKWVIVGHWPVMLYGGDTACANPIIDRESRIISIDGGSILKDDGQLNALIIPHNGSSDFDFVAYDSFPIRRVKTAQEGSKKSIYVRWGDNRVRVLERGEEFSRCLHISSGYELDILTEFLYGETEEVWCNDCTDYILPLRAGDEVSVVKETSRGYLVKHKGTCGWYFGELS